MMERLIRTSPAYDRRNETPNYGQHPLEFHFIVRDERGALAFTFVTGWYIEEMRQAQIGESGSFREHRSSEYCRLSLHVPATLENSVDHDPHENCGWLNGDSCQASEPFGGTGEAIGDLAMTLITEGLDGLWRAMEKHFEELMK